MANGQVDVVAGLEVRRDFGVLVATLLLAVGWLVEFTLARWFDATPTMSAGQDKRDGPPYIASLGFARFLFAWLVVLHDFYLSEACHSSKASAWALLARWGAISAPFFYLTSGFVNTYAKLVGPHGVKEEDIASAMLRRVARWWPLYAMAITICAMSDFSPNAEDWARYLARLLLISGLIWMPTSGPGCGEAAPTGLPCVMNDQWLCFLAVYLLAWSPMCEVLSDSKNNHLWFLLVACAALSLPFALSEWYFVDTFALLGLVQSFPSFVFGQALATWFVRNCLKRSADGVSCEARPAEDLHWLVRLGATVAMLSLSLIFFVASPYDEVPLLHKEAAPLVLKGGLLPLLGLLVVGLAAGGDPVARLLSRRPFRWGNKLSLAIFLFHAPVMHLVQVTTGRAGLTCTACGVLLLTSVAVHFGVERPFRQALGLREK